MFFRKINTKININIKENTHREIQICWAKGNVPLKYTRFWIRHIHTYTHTHHY
jgi:hypothetical protein